PAAGDRARCGVDDVGRDADRVAGCRRGDDHRRRGADPRMKLVLFDIDGTILWSDGAGRRAMTAALTSVFGGAGPTEYRYDGKTDPQIVRDLMRAEGHSDETIDARMDSVASCYVSLLQQELATGRRTMRVFDGVAELITALEAR